MAHATRPPMPLRDGVSASCVATVAGPWPLLLDFLAVRLPAVSREDWAGRMARGEVLDDAARPLPPDTPHRPGQRVHYYRTLAHEPPIPYEARIVHQDELLLVADKPHYLPVTPTGRYVQQSLLVRLKRLTGIATLSPVHRIDRETAGLVLFALRPETRDAYHRLFRDQQVAKDYEAIAPAPPPGWPHALPLTRQTCIQEDPAAFYRMVETPDSPNSTTHIQLLEQRGPWARYLLTPDTGRRHQLRVHMNGLGLPLCGDQFYPQVRRGPGEPEDFADPLRLLAREIAFTDPVSGQPRRFCSALTLAWPEATSQAETAARSSTVSI